MGMFDGDWGLRPQAQPAEPEPQPMSDMTPADPEPQPMGTPAEEPQAASDVTPADPQPQTADPQPQAAPAPKASGGKPARRPKPANPWTLERVAQARRVLEALADPTALGVAARAVGMDGSEPDRIALACLRGELAAPLGFLVRVRDEASAMRRGRILYDMANTDSKTLRAAARLMTALDPSLSDAIRPQGGNVMDLAEAMGERVDALDLDPIRALVE